MEPVTKQTAINQPDSQQEFHNEILASNPFGKILLIILGVIVLIGIVCGSYYLGTKKGTNTTANLQTKTSPTSIQSSSISDPTANLQTKTSPTSIQSSSISDPTANWKTFENTQIMMKIPPTFYIADLPTYEGGGTEKYVFDSEATKNIYTSTRKLSSNNIAFSFLPPPITNLLLTNPQRHSDKEILQKLFNLGNSFARHAQANEIIPWTNLGDGTTYKGDQNFLSTVPFEQMTIDNHLAGKAIVDNAIVYIILNGTNGRDSVMISISPASTVFTDEINPMIQSIKFKNK